jgi:O-antigen ligase
MTAIQRPGMNENPGWWAGHHPAPEWWRIESPRRPSPADHGQIHSEQGGADNGAAFWGVMAFTFVLLISPQSTVPALAPLRPAFLSAVGSAVALLLYRFTHGQPLTPMTREMWIVAALSSWAIVTIPWSYWPGGSVALLSDVYAKSLAIFWLLANTLDTPRRLRRVAWALTAMAAVVALVGVRHFLSGVFYRPGASQSVERVMGYGGPLTMNPNDLALTLNLLLPLAVALLLLARRPSARLALTAAIGLSVVAIIMTFSRAGFITLGATFLVYLWKFRGRPERRFMWGLIAGLVVIMLAGLPLLPASYIERLDTITDIKADPTGSAEARWDDTFAALRLVQHHPIVGAGLGQNILALNSVRGARWTEVHNVYLEYAVDMGLPGLALFLVLLAHCLRATMLVQRDTAGREEVRELFCLAEAVHVSLLAFVVAGMFHPVAYHFYFYYVAGLALAIRETWRARGGAPAPAGDPLPRAGA